MEALDEDFLTVVFSLLLNRIQFLQIFEQRNMEVKLDLFMCPNKQKLPEYCGNHKLLQTSRHPCHRPVAQFKREKEIN